MSKYEPVIGLEIHLETKTNSKMFSPAPVNFDAPPNACVTSIDLGEPGTLPSVNKKAVEKAIIMALALKMEIDHLLRFDRKNYFYADLPKGFQITQNDFPLGREGWLEIFLEDGSPHLIELERLHMEEDTCKQLHFADYSLLDYNRAGTPLVEIVSKPVLRNGYEAMKYVEKIRSIAQYLNVSDGKMEEGSLRCDVNISLRPVGSTKFGTKVEIKNLNSIANVRKAIEYEIIRQSAMLERGEVIQQETRRFDESKKETVLMRLKNDAVDYKYFREDNILPIRLSKEYVKEIVDGAPESPDAKYQRYTMDYLISHEEAILILQNIPMALFFDQVCLHTKEYQSAAKFLKGEISAYLNSQNKSFADLDIYIRPFANLFTLLGENKIDYKTARLFFEKIVNEQADPHKLYEASKQCRMSEHEIKTLVIQILEANPQSIVDYFSGRDRAFGFLIGQIMKLSQGKADPKISNEILRQELEARR